MRSDSADNRAIFVSGVHVPFTKGHGISSDFSRVRLLRIVRVRVVCHCKILQVPFHGILYQTGSHMLLPHTAVNLDARTGLSLLCAVGLSAEKLAWI